jgi:hypothetical protein
MALLLMVNGHQIGFLVARRRSPAHPAPDDLCLYEWQLNLNGVNLASADTRPLAHRFGDGAWVLVAKVIEAAEKH